jgi:branched-chain amino acid transport system ATP-binding protein
MPTHERIRRGLRRTYQNSMLFRGLTVGESLFLAAQGVIGGRQSLRRPAPDHPARLSARELARYVHLDAVLDRIVAELSHGQQRQLELGMALAGAPRLILFDEPGAGLSPAERQDLIALLRALPAHVGFVLIEHDLDIALAVVDSVTVMHNGRIFKHGSPAEIESDPEVQSIYLGENHG